MGPRLDGSLGSKPARTASGPRHPTQARDMARDRGTPDGCVPIHHRESGMPCCCACQGGRRGALEREVSADRRAWRSPRTTTKVRCVCEVKERMSDCVIIASVSRRRTAIAVAVSIHIVSPQVLMQVCVRPPCARRRRASRRGRTRARHLGAHEICSSRCYIAQR